MGTKHLTEADRLRARMLFFDSGLSKARICQLTGFSLNQVKLAIREKTPKSRCGRPPRRRPSAAGALAGLNTSTGAAMPAPAGGAYMPERSFVAGMGGMTSAGGDGSLGTAPGSMPEAAGMEAAAASAHAGGHIHHAQHHHHHILHRQDAHHQQQPLPPHHPQHQQPQHHNQHQQHHYQEQHQHPHQNDAPIRHKWEPEYSPTSCYAWASLPPPPPSASSTVSSASTHYGHYGRPLSPPAPPINSLRTPSSSSSLLGIHALAGYDRGYHDGHGSEASPHGLLSAMSTSSATSYSSMSPSPSGISASAVGGHGGFSLPAILATATRP